MSGERGRLYEAIPGRPGEYACFTITRFGSQPAWDRLIEQMWSLPALAEQIGVKHSQLYGAVSGRTVPIQTVRDRLPAVLGFPLKSLFTSDALAATPRERKP